MGRQAKQIVEIPYWAGISHAVPQKYVGVGVCECKWVCDRTEGQMKSEYIYIHRRVLTNQ